MADICEGLYSESLVQEKGKTSGRGHRCWSDALAQALGSYLQISPAQFSQPPYARNTGFLARRTVSELVLIKGPAEVNLGCVLILGKHLPENTLLSMPGPEISHD